MIELRTKVKKWGNSLGIMLPKTTGVKENQDVVVHISPARQITRVGEIFGKGKLQKSVSRLMKEIDEELG